MLLSRIKNYAKEKYGEQASQNFDLLRLRSVFVDKNKKVVKYLVSLPLLPSEEEKEELIQIVRSFSCNGFKVLLEIERDKMDAEIFLRIFWDFLKESCPSVYLEICDSREQVIAQDQPDGRISVLFKVSKKVKEILYSGALNKIEKYFSSFTCCPIDYFVNEAENEDIDLQKTLTHLGEERERTLDAYLSQPERKIKFAEKRILIGKSTSDSAQYIIDVLPAKDYVTVCGSIGNFAQRPAKNKDMTICRFTVQDFSGVINVVYFAKSEKDLSALMGIYSGDNVVVSGKSQLNSYSNKLELIAYSVGICKIMPGDYVLDEFKPVPPEYVKVSPMPIESFSQVAVLEENKKIPEVLLKKSFVVFDLETTGFQTQLDKIIEIGAVKIVDGQIVESFNTLINPQIPIPLQSQECNHINDDMVRDKPMFAEVCGDFYKFAHDSVLVAHNISFDHGFLDYYARPCGYLFNNTLVDTLNLASKYSESLSSKLRPKNLKLETLVKYFKFTEGDFHRALYDSMVTAKLFLKLLSLDESLLDKNL